LWFLSILWIFIKEEKKKRKNGLNNILTQGRMESLLEIPATSPLLKRERERKD